jgi:hypothetical protein
MRKSQLVILSLFLLVFGCSKTSDTSSASTTTCSSTISFATDVNPLISTYCATNSSCHGTGSSNGPGALTTYAQIYNARTSISSDVSSGVMPRGTTLTSAQKTMITCWISNGAQNN